MRVLKFRIKNFRGFKDFELRPGAHALVVGPPGNGKSDLIEALSRVLEVENTRRRAADEFDFFGGNVAEPVQIEATLGDLNSGLRQHFLMQLEVWDRNAAEIADELQTAEELDEMHSEFVVRLGYDLRWSDDDGAFVESQYFPKLSDPNSDLFDIVRRGDLDAIGFSRMRESTGRVLDLGPRSGLRKLLEASGGGDFNQALKDYVKGVAAAADAFGQTTQLKAAAQRLVDSLGNPPRLDRADPDKLLQFTPEGGAQTSLLRSLAAAVEIGDGAGRLPLGRQSSTLVNLIRVGETLGSTVSGEGIIAIDDLGDGIDPGSAAHVASILRRRSSQAWITTRSSLVGEVFEPEETIRLGRDESGERQAFVGRAPANRRERAIFKSWRSRIMPALSYDAIVIFEGQHDLDAFNQLAAKLLVEQEQPIPASQGVALIAAGEITSGGDSWIEAIAKVTKDFGLWTVGIIDGDKGKDELAERLAASADAVIRLPEAVAVERALLSGLADETLRKALKAVARAAHVKEPDDLDSLAGSPLHKAGRLFLKTSGGLHGIFVNLLPPGQYPSIASTVLSKAVEAARNKETGITQL